MGALLAWAIVAVLAPVYASGDIFPEAALGLALGALLTYLPERCWPSSEHRLEQCTWAIVLLGVAGGLIRVPFLVSGYATTPASAIWMTVAR